MQIFVLGMHRSGTSPLTRIINMMGAYVGMEGTLMEPNKDNPKGFWERNDVYALHQEVLKAIGASWHEVAHFDLGKLSDHDRAAFEKRARTIIQNLDAHRPWVLKDPRLCLLLPLWQPLLETPICVHICRSPLQVAQSLRTRNGFPIHFGAALWEKYNLTALTQSRDLPRLFVSHKRLLGQPLETVRALYEQLLTLGVQGLHLPSEREILAFLDPSLYRERGESNLEKEFVNFSQEALFQAFEERTASDFDGACSLSAGALEALENHEVTERRERQQVAEVQTLQQRLAEAGQVRVALEQSKTTEVKALQQRLTEAEQVRVALEQSKTTEVKALQQRLTEAEQVRVALEQSKTTEVKALQQRLAEAGQVRVALEQSKTTEVKALQQRLTEAEQARTAEVQALQRYITKSDQNRETFVAEAQVLKQQIAEGEQEHERLRRSVQEKAADIVELQKAIEKTKKDFDVAQRQAEEGYTFQTRFREAERTIVTNNQEITALRADVKEQVQEIDSLVRHVGKLDRAITSILESKRWKLGDTLGAYYRKIRFKSPLPDLHVYQEQMREALQSWLKDRKKKDHAPVVPNAPQVILSPPQPSVAAQSPLPSVDIVICVHNALEDVKACLSSVVAQASVPFTLYLVNDGSDAPTTNFLRQFSKQHPFCTLLESPAAEGYTRAANRGLRASTADYVVMLNSDTIVPTAWLECLLECGSSDPRIGIVGPLSNAASWQSIPDCLSPTGDWATNSLPPGLTVEDMALLVRALSPQRFPRVPFLNGFCFIIKRDVISAIGLFDEERFPKGYGEENDYCLRAADAGFGLAVADNAYVYHAKSKSYGHQTRERSPNKEAQP